MWKYLIGFIIAALVLFRVYDGALRAPFFFDDLTLPFYRADYHLLPLPEWLSGIRPAVMFTYWLNYQQSALSPHGYHLLNIWLHFFNSILAFFLVRKLARFVENDTWKLNVLSAFCAALFLLHPIQTDAVAYITGRSDLLSSFFVLTALAIFLYRRALPSFTPYALIIVIIFALACGAKESAVVLPVLLLFTDRFWLEKSYWSAMRKAPALYGSLALLSVAGAVYVWQILSAAVSAGFHLKDVTWYQYFFTECRAVWVYIGLLALPLHQSVDHDFPVSATLLDRGAGLGLAALLIAIWMAWHYRRQYPLGSYGFAFFLIALAPTSSFIPIADPLVERRLYLPMLGILLIVFDLLRRVNIGRNSLLAALLAVLSFNAVLAGWRCALWADPVGLWQDAARQAPRKPRTRLGLAAVLVQAGRCSEAIPEYTAVEHLLSSRNARNTEIFRETLVDWGLAYRCLKQPEAALAKLLQAAQLSPSAHLYSQIGMVYQEMGSWTESVAFLQRAVQLDPAYEPSYVYLGNLFMLHGQPDKAVAYYRRALELIPEDQYAREALLASQYRAEKSESSRSAAP